MVFTKLEKNENMTTDVLGKIRAALPCDISAIKESEDYFFILIKGGHAVLKKGCFTVGDENGFASFISEKTSLKIRAAK